MFFTILLLLLVWGVWFMTTYEIRKERAKRAERYKMLMSGDSLVRRVK